MHDLCTFDTDHQQSLSDRVVALITKQYLQISLVTRTQTCQNGDHEQRRPGTFSECKRISPPAAGALQHQTPFGP